VKSVDVFYLSDTTYVKSGPSSPVIGLIDDPNMRRGAQVKFTTTASVFKPFANIFAPYNRQVDARYKSTAAHRPAAVQHPADPCSSARRGVKKPATVLCGRFWGLQPRFYVGKMHPRELSLGRYGWE